MHNFAYIQKASVQYGIHLLLLFQCGIL